MLKNLRQKLLNKKFLKNFKCVEGSRMIPTSIDSKFYVTYLLYVSDFRFCKSVGFPANRKKTDNSEISGDIRP